MQIHVQDGGKKVHIYSRNAEDMTPRYPDILSRLPGWLGKDTQSIVIDGEAVAWDPEKSKILPFQVSAALARYLACLLCSIAAGVQRSVLVFADAGQNIGRCNTFQGKCMQPVLGRLLCLMGHPDSVLPHSQFNHPAVHVRCSQQWLC